MVENHYVGDAGVPSLSRWPDAQPTIPLHAGRRYRRRHLSGRGQHPPRPERTRPSETGRPSRYRHGRRRVRLCIPGSCHGRCRRRVDWQWRRPVDGQADALPALYHSRSADRRGCIEEKFWRAFGDVIGCKAELRDDLADPEASITEVAAFWRFTRPRTGRRYCRGRLLLHYGQDLDRGGIRPFRQARPKRLAGANRGQARARPADTDCAGLSRRPSGTMPRPVRATTTAISGWPPHERCRQER